MNNPAKNIVQQLFGVTSLSDVNTTELSQVASKHPYFGPIQFLLSQKLKEAQHYEADAQLKKAAVYFTNPYWLNYLLHENEIAAADFEIEENGEVENASFEEPLLIVEENKEQKETIEESNENIVDNSEEIEQPTEVFELPEKDEIVPAIEVKHDEVVPEVDEIIPAVELIEEPEADEIIPAIEVANDELHDSPDEIVPAVEITNDELHDSPDEIIPAIEVANDELHDTPEAIIPAVEMEIQHEEEEPKLETNVEETQRLKLSSLIEQHLADFKKPVDENAALPIKSAPYHTVDYFASQGIKADGQDKLSSRVRKFTDWLKQMKGTTPQPTDLGTDAETEQMIETIAKTSNETKDIITEAMAEVLVKQGKTEKAIQLYKKLSFLNPAKTAYFAAKIDELNNK